MTPDRVFYPLAALVAGALIAFALVYPQGEGARSPGPFGHPPTQQVAAAAAALVRRNAAIADEQKKAALAQQNQQKHDADAGLRTTPLK